MYRGNHYEYNHINRWDRDPDKDDTNIFLTGAMAFAISFFLASLVPEPFVAATLSSLLHIGAIIFALSALWRDHFVLADQFTYWDLAAFFHGLSIALAWFIDPEAVQTAIDSYSQVPAGMSDIDKLNNLSPMISNYTDLGRL